MKYKTVKIREKDYNRLKELAESFGLTIQDLINRLTRDVQLLPENCKPWSSDVVYCFNSKHRVWVPCLRYGDKLFCYDLEKGTYVPFSES